MPEQVLASVVGTSCAATLFALGGFLKLRDRAAVALWLENSGFPRQLFPFLVVLDLGLAAALLLAEPLHGNWLAAGAGLALLTVHAFLAFRGTTDCPCLGASGLSDRRTILGLLTITVAVNLAPLLAAQVSPGLPGDERVLLAAWIFVSLSAYSVVLVRKAAGTRVTRPPAVSAETVAAYHEILRADPRYSAAGGVILLGSLQCTSCVQIATVFSRLAASSRGPYLLDMGVPIASRARMGGALLTRIPRPLLRALEASKRPCLIRITDATIETYSGVPDCVRGLWLNIDAEPEGASP